MPRPPHRPSKFVTCSPVCHGRDRTRGLRLGGNNPHQLSCTWAGTQQRGDKNKKGGWVTFPFIIGSVMGLSLAATTWYANIVIYAINKYNITNIAAAQLFNVVNGGINFFPIVGAILADSLFGPYTVVLVSSFVSLLAAIMFTISSAIPSLRPPSCIETISKTCQPPSNLQYAFLYATLLVSVIGFGGTRFVLAAFGANQFKKHDHQQVFFNWFIFSIEATSVIGYTAIVYLQDKGHWTVSFGITAALALVVITVFIFGSRFYHQTMPQGSPFVSIARVIVASFRKSFKKVGVEVHDHEYFYGSSESNKLVHKVPSSSLRFFNRAALIKEGDEQTSSIITKSWRLCTVEEVEDLKKLIKALPIWSGGILLSTISGVASSLSVLQALSMDRAISPRFTMPASSILVFALICGTIMISFLDRVVYPLWKKAFGQSLKTLKRVGIGYFIAFLSMVSFALIERKRLIRLEPIQTRQLMEQSQAHAMTSMSVLWLILPVGLLGISSSFYYPAEIEFFYQELPKSLRSTATALASLHFAVGYYLSTVFIDVVQRGTSWFPNDGNHGRMDKVYWTLAIIGGVNFGYYVICAMLYKYTYDESRDKTDDDEQF